MPSVARCEGDAGERIVFPDVESGRQRRFQASYIGCCDLKPRYTKVDLNDAIEQLSQVSSLCIGVTIEVVTGKIITYSQDGDEMLCHDVRDIQSLASTANNKPGFVYVHRVKSSQTKGSFKTKCYLFLLDSFKKAPELFNVVQEEKSFTSNESLIDGTKAGTNNQLTAVPQKFTRSASLCGDSPPNFSQFFEVLCLGKIKSSHKRAPPTFIDEALQKFKQKQEKKDVLRSRSPNIPSLECPPCHPLDNPPRVSPSKTENDCDTTTASTSDESRNRTMLLQVGRSDLRLISPDTKQVLLHKSFREISHCACGLHNKECFGFICRESGQSQYLGYIFRCDSVGVVEDIMQGLRSAFHNAHEQSKKEKSEQRCAHCPIVWYNNIAQEINGVSVSKAQGIILKSLERLEAKDKESILAKMSGAETTELSEQNQVLMMLLKVSCEVKQDSHEHTGPSLGTSLGSVGTLGTVTPGQELFMLEAVKSAKRSLAESFSGIMRRRASTEVVSEPPLVTVTGSSPAKTKPVMPHPLSVTNAERRLLMEKKVSPEKIQIISPNKMEPLTPSKQGQYEMVLSGGSPTRQRAKTVGSAGGETMKRELARRRLAKLKEEVGQDEKTDRTDRTDATSNKLSIFLKTGAKSPGSPTSLKNTRQQIFERVATPDKLAGLRKKSAGEVREARDYRLLWQNAIKQQIMLGRMERENARMLENEEQLAERRLKLDYKDLRSDKICGETWDRLLSKCGESVTEEELRQGVSVGIPQARRGEAWHLLTTRLTDNKLTDSLVEKFPNLTAKYNSLKSQLTSHQHAILIDLGRTFPSHGYFSGALGPGQCGLFNLLKAYSILDPEVGYCQGLPFCVGLLLMHSDEEEAFSQLKYLMFDVGLRKQFHPDMTGLQVSLYCMTRLLAETHPGLYKHLDRLEADPSLYATPWFLTLFAAHFPLGFVCRVLDLIFLEGSAAVITKVAVCLLLELAPRIFLCTNLEELMTTMKTELPNFSQSRLEDVLTQAASLNVSRQLGVYEIEFSVLQEEQSSTRSKVEKLTRALQESTRETEALNKKLASKDLQIQNLKALLEQSVGQQRHKDNNNSGSLTTQATLAVNHRQDNCEDKLYRVLAAVEALSTQVPDDIRCKLEDIATIGKPSWFKDLNSQKFDVDDDWENLLTNEDDDYLSDNVLCEDIDIDEGSWKSSWKLSRSPIFGTFFGN